MIGEAMTLERTRPETCLSDLVLDRFVARELERSEQGERVRRHLEACDPCRARSRVLEEAASAFKREIFVSGLAVQAERAVKRSPIRRLASFGAIAAVFLGAIVLVRSAASDDPIRVKGGLGLGVVARRLDGNTEQVLPGAELRPGEAIRFEVSARKKGYLFIAGIDSAKNVTPYYPGPNAAGIFSPGVGQLLDGSVTLDGTLGAERIFALLCDEPIDGPKVIERGRAALQRAGGDPAKIERLDSGCSETSFVISKVPSP
jgi:hypothetical protein